MEKQSDPDFLHLTEEALQSTQLYQGRLLDLRLDRVRLPDGSEATRRRMGIF